MCAEQANIDRLTGWRACISPVVMKPIPFCNCKSTNYLQNALAKIEAEANGYDLVRWLDGLLVINACCPFTVATLH